MKYPTGVVLLTADEARRLLHVDPALLRQWAKRGRIIREKPNEYDMGSILNYLETRGTRGQRAA